MRGSYSKRHKGRTPPKARRPTKIAFRDKRLVLDDRVVERSETFIIHDDRYLYIYDAAAARRFSLSTFAEIERSVAELNLPISVPWNELLSKIEIRVRQSEYWQRRIQFQFAIEWEEWAKPYSIAEYAEAVKYAADRLKTSVNYYREDDEFITNGFGLECSLQSMNVTVASELKARLQDVRAVSDAAFADLAERGRKNALVTFFDFPPAVRSSCEQYLLYFVQFLADLGIAADADLKHEAGRVLFSVTPREGKAALKRVRDALDLYLRLPDAEEFDGIAYEINDPAVRQLQANVHFLRGQLCLATAMLQAKDASIAALKVANYQYEQLLVAKPSRPRDAHDKLDVLGDTVALKPYEGKILRIETPKLARRLPELLRALKRFVGISDH